MYKLLSLALVLATLQGCVSGVTRTPLNTQTANAIQQANTYNLVIQDEIRPAVNISNVTGAMGGGLIPALIDSSINKSRNRSAQEVMAGFYDATQDHDFRTHLAADFNTAIASALPLKVTQAPAEFVLLSNEERERRIAALGAGEALVYTSSFYMFIDQSKRFVTESQVYVYTKPTKASKNTLPVYFNRFSYVSKTLGNGQEDSIAAWSANQGAEFRTEIGESTTAIADMIAMDIKSHKDKYCGKQVKASLMQLGQLVSANATLVAEKDERAWVQEVNGALVSVPAAGLVPNPKAKAVKCS